MKAEKIYIKAESVSGAIASATEHINDFRYLAGGTDVIVNRIQGNDGVGCLIDITGIRELKQVSIENNFLQIGSLVRLDELKNHPVIVEKFAALVEAARSVATPVLRKTATIGGNILCENRCIFYNQSEWWREAVGYCLKCEGEICIATGGTKACFSKFVSDTAPVLISFDALVVVSDNEGDRLVKLQDIYSGDGVTPKKLSQTAILKYILLPLDREFRCVFMKLRPRRSIDYSSLTTAVCIDKAGLVRIALGGVDPGPVVLLAESLSLRQELVKQALRKSRIVDNEVYSRPYRREMIKVFLERSMNQLNGM